MAIEVQACSESVRDDHNRDANAVHELRPLLNQVERVADARVVGCSVQRRLCRIKWCLLAACESQKVDGSTVPFSIRKGIRAS